ncbi:hypothetical protein V6N11_067672 [Hibiscus sabdariffa]|uniref:Uncharacterized protein n=1 Tax=Hibiscus sabdariffa TaxID=183260 RepID=A0ABR2SRJ6_9ROSI
MIGVFDAAATVTPNNPRKHRRFDKEPPDRGGPGNQPPQSDVVVDADGIMIPPSYKDSLLHGNGTVPGGEEFDEDDDIDILEGEVIRSMIDGLISIEFSDRIQKLAAKSLDQTLVIKLLGHRIDSCPDILRPQQPTTVNDLPQPLIDHSVGIDAASVTVGASKTTVDNTPYGLWMVVELGPRRAPRKQQENNVRQQGIVLRENCFNAISMPELNMCDDNDTNALTRPSSSVRTAPTAPLVFRAKQRVKGKSTVISKVSSGTHVRKPLTLSDFSVLSRSSHKDGSSKSVPTQVVSLDASKHSAVVIGENSDPNIQQSMPQFPNPPTL